MVSIEYYKVKHDKKVLIECIDENESESYGFLWLRKRAVKTNGLTKGKLYSIIAMESTDYGNAYVSCKFVYVLVVNDNGIKQLYNFDRFQLTKSDEAAHKIYTDQIIDAN
jgi:hypothetical protein